MTMKVFRVFTMAGKVLSEKVQNTVAPMKLVDEVVQENGNIVSTFTNKFGKTRTEVTEMVNNPDIPSNVLDALNFGLPETKINKKKSVFNRLF